VTTNLLDYMPFAQGLGLDVEVVSKSLVRASLEVSKTLCTTGKIMHGGAIMAVADTLGAIAAYQNLPEGAKATTTVESKTNFLGAAPLGCVVIAVTTPLHVGRRTSVWQTLLRKQEGGKIALVTQTQLVLT